MRRFDAHSMLGVHTFSLARFTSFHRLADILAAKPLLERLLPMDLWVGDSIVAKPRVEPLTTLAYCAAITTRARLGTAILLPALRQPTVLAHALASLDQISGGRLVLGLGAGWGLPEIKREWEACGRPHNRRGKELEEQVATVSPTTNATRT